jgi:hypothetical protein
MPKQAITANCTSAHVGTPGTLKTMPIKAQNTMSWITRGLVNALNWRHVEGKAEG